SGGPGSLSRHGGSVSWDHCRSTPLCHAGVQKELLAVCVCNEPTDQYVFSQSEPKGK
ncbi:hypothetical protein SARC_15620, partial [Sphaeroforma arctica JP610]